MDRKRPPQLKTKVLGVPLHTKVLDTEQGIVESIVAVMGNIDDGGDRILNGAFSKSLSEAGKRIRVLDGHNTGSVRDIVGKPLELRELTREALPPELLAAYPDATGGLYAKTQFLIDTPEGKGVFDRLKSGAAYEWSIGYDPLRAQPVTETISGKQQRVRNLAECRLWEYSPVIWGMNSATATMSAKGATNPPAINFREAFERAYTLVGQGKTIQEAVAAIEATEKEMVGMGGDPIEYPIQRLRDVLYGATRCTYMGIVDSLLVQGVLATEEHSLLCTMADEHFATILAGIPDEVGARQVHYYGPSAAGYMAADDPTEAKAGRVLSQANATALLSAAATIREILGRAGYLDDEDDDGGEKGREGKEAAGPLAPLGAAEEAPPDAAAPTDDDLAALLKLRQVEIDLDLDPSSEEVK